MPKKSKYKLSVLGLTLISISFSLQILADVNPLGTTRGTTLGGSSPYTNEGTISGPIYGISTNTDNGATVTNSGTIAVTGANNHGIVTNGDNPSITNSGLITTSGDASAGIANWGAANGTFTNTLSGVINASGTNAWGLSLLNLNFSIFNYGTITSSGTLSMAISFAGGGNLTNDGIIDSSGGSYSAIWTNTGVTNITNNGSITADSFGIRNTASIDALNNAQGGDSLTPSTTVLTFTGTLPINYNIIINSATHYGQLSGSSISGSTNFGINNGSTITTKLYTGVLQGLTTSNVGATRSGTYNGLNWTLALQSGSSTIWDLIFTGGSTADTQASMTPNAYALRGAYSLQSAIINTGLSYDCTTFDKNGICLSAGGRMTDTVNPSTNSQGALLIASYRANDNWRIGGYLDQNLSTNDARGVNLDNSNPMGGIFAVWNQNTDGTGYQVRVAAGYSDKNVTISRSVIGTAEAGTGDSSLRSQAYSVTVSHGFQINNTGWIASPYLGVRYTKIKRAGYTEDSSADVTAPLTYSALSQETTTALAGVRFNGQFGDKVNVIASAGIENDIAHNTGDYAATGVDSLTPIAFNQNIRHIRPLAQAGVRYAIDKRQTIGANLHYRQEAFNSTHSVTGMVNYELGF